MSLDTSQKLSANKSIELQKTKENDMSKSKHPLLSEDWTVVLLGFLIILFTLFAFLLPVPSFGWKTAGDLAAKVFSVSNLGSIGLQFVFVAGIAAIGVLVTGKSIQSFFAVFSIVYLLTIVALV